MALSEEVVTGGGLWEFKNSCHFDFMLSAWCLLFKMWAFTFCSGCHACCLLLRLSAMTDSSVFGTISQMNSSLYKFFWASCENSHREVTKIDGQLGITLESHEPGSHRNPRTRHSQSAKALLFGAESKASSWGCCLGTELRPAVFFPPKMLLHQSKPSVRKLWQP